ncbi:proline dehydrogenase family protein [Natrinema halophilum]|uniref:proline dehydrogenase family protein n=1 Tax=Natrinema halophilum TaxID=1699371 RepID=UPI001F45E027|nr:proline dehydrogenase family protein [Natrinema halophilum]UHQ96391.1 proline dehydrogenase family protein [Natrinema halophilum]
MIPPIANNFVAGKSSVTALERAAQNREDGLNTILNLLGEHHDDSEEVAADTEAYCSLIDEIGTSAIDACVSVKPSQIGLEIDAEAFETNLRRIVDLAATNDVFIWIDMENSGTTDVTLDTYEALAREYGGGIGVCLQANLRRTREDLARFADVPGKVRLVKGAYDEPESIAYKDKSDVDEAYRTLLEDAFEHREDGIAVGSHDPAMIKYASQLHDEYGTPYEVQMLMGVREDAQRELASEGVDVYQYVPYGSRWLQYFYRRVRERKENVLFALRAITGSSIRNRS